MALAEDDVLAFFTTSKNKFACIFLRELQLDQELEMLQKLIDGLF